MKIEWNSKYKTISVYVIITATIIALILLALSNLGVIGGAIASLFSILMPFIVGFAAAYLLYRPAMFIEKHWFAFIEKRKPHPGVRRGLSILTLFIIVFGLLVLFIYFVIPQLFESTTMLFKNIPTYLNDLETTIVNWLKSVNLYTDEIAAQLEDFGANFLNFTNILNQFVSQIPSLITSVGTGLFNFFVGIIVSVYVLYSRERFLRHGKKVVFATFKKDFALKFMDVFRYSNDVFLGFIMGTLGSTAFVGLCTFVFMTICQMPYALLITVIIAVTNIIPFFGPFLGAIPSVIILLMVDPIDALIFIIFILVLQQVDGNIILPRSIGMHTGLSAFWVLFALLMGGGLFGFWGLILGVPVFAVIYSLVTALMKSSIQKKEIPDEYVNTPADIIKEDKKPKKEKRESRWRKYKAASSQKTVKSSAKERRRKK